jgi:FeS assembly SUF system protein
MSSESLRERVLGELKQVFDPEIPVNIYELGMIYRVEAGEDGNVEIDMTLTSPACPVAGSLPGEVQARVAALDEVSEARVNLVWEPAWHQGLMSEAAKLELGLL